MKEQKNTVTKLPHKDNLVSNDSVVSRESVLKGNRSEFDSRRLANNIIYASASEEYGKALWPGKWKTLAMLAVVVVLFALVGGGFYVLQENTEANSQLLSSNQEQAQLTGFQEQLSDDEADFDAHEWRRKYRLRSAAVTYLRKGDDVAVFYLSDTEDDPGTAMTGVGKRPIVRAMQAIERFSSFRGSKKVPEGAEKAVRQSVLDDVILAYTARAEVALSEEIVTEIDTRIDGLRQLVADNSHFQDWVKLQYGSMEVLRETVTDTVLTERYLAARGQSRKELLGELYTTLEVLWENNTEE